MCIECIYYSKGQCSPKYIGTNCCQNIPFSCVLSAHIGPKAKPKRVRYDDLPPVPLSVGYEGEVALSGWLGMGVYGFGGSEQQQQQQQGDVGGGGFGNECVYDGDLGGQVLGVGVGEVALAVVSKLNVMTGRTANASHKWRKQEAMFVCPILGCGSTFTRSFNLEGWFEFLFFSFVLFFCSLRFSFPFPFLLLTCLLFRFSSLGYGDHKKLISSPNRPHLLTQRRKTIPV